jgi:hypothetical protein
LRFWLVHDGTAAAALHAGTAEGAVLVIGTALGVGFTLPTETGLRAVSPELRLCRLRPDEPLLAGPGASRSA